MPIVGNNRDFEVLAMARKAGARGESLARIERRLREVEDANRTVVTPPAGINNLLIGSDFDHSIFTFNGSGSHTDLINWFRGVNPALPVGTAASNPAWRMETDLLDWVLGGTLTI